MIISAADDYRWFSASDIFIYWCNIIDAIIYLMCFSLLIASFIDIDYHCDYYARWWWDDDTPITFLSLCADITPAGMNISMLRRKMISVDVTLCRRPRSRVISNIDYFPMSRRRLMYYFDKDYFVVFDLGFIFDVPIDVNISFFFWCWCWWWAWFRRFYVADEDISWADYFWCHWCAVKMPIDVLSFLHFIFISCEISMIVLSMPIDFLLYFLSFHISSETLITPADEMMM